MKLILDLDDLEINSLGMELLFKIREHFPNFKVTAFTIPLPSAILSREVPPEKFGEWGKFLNENPWIEVAPHGLTHMGHEMKEFQDERGIIRKMDYKTANIWIDAAEHSFRQIGVPWIKVWKNPFWETSDAALQALKDRGYIVAIDPNRPEPKIPGLKTYKYDWSIEHPLPSRDIVKGHGHMNTMENSLIKCFTKLMDLPTNTEFMTIGEFLKIKPKVHREKK